MSDQNNYIVLEHLRAICADISQIKADIIEIKGRLGLLECTYAALSRRVDRIGADVEQFKTWLAEVETQLAGSQPEGEQTQ